MKIILKTIIKLTPSSTLPGKHRLHCLNYPWQISLSYHNTFFNSPWQSPPNINIKFPNKHPSKQSQPPWQTPLTLISTARTNTFKPISTFPDKHLQTNLNSPRQTPSNQFQHSLTNTFKPISTLPDKHLQTNLNSPRQTPSNQSQLPNTNLNSPDKHL